MSKELWLQAYETAIEDLANDNDIDMEEAEKLLQIELDNDPQYLDGYLDYDINEERLYNPNRYYGVEGMF